MKDTAPWAYTELTTTKPTSDAVPRLNSPGLACVVPICILRLGSIVSNTSTGRYPRSTVALPLSQVIEQERRRWMSFRRALSKEDQAACNRVLACATQPLQAAVQLGRSWGFEAMMLAILLGQRMMEEQVERTIETLAHEHRSEGHKSV
jgi:hypothetical protein